MIDWIDENARDWGDYMSREPNSYPKMSSFAWFKEGKILGDAIVSHGAVVPIKGMPPYILRFHRAWLTLPEKLNRVVYLFYVVGRRWEPKKKAKALRMSKSGMYARLDAAHEAIGLEMMRQLAQSRA